MKPEEYPRLLISGGILFLFAFAFVRNPSDMLLIGALISMGSTVVQYWLGSSKGSADNATRADKALDIVKQVQDDK